MTFRTIEKKNFSPFIENLIQAMEVVGVREKVEGKYEFAPLESPSQLRLDYDVTLLSPKKYLLPSRETLLRFKTGKAVSCEPALESRPLAIVRALGPSAGRLVLLSTAFTRATSSRGLNGFTT